MKSVNITSYHTIFTRCTIVTYMKLGIWHFVNTYIVKPVTVNNINIVKMAKHY